MADTANFSFKDDAGKSGSDSDNGDAKSSGTGGQPESRPSGFINPEIARSTGGNNQSNGSDPAASATKRGPGRPRKDGSPAGSANAPKAQKERGININGIEQILFSVHAVAASMLQIPDLELDETEAKRLANAIQNVNSAYRVEFDPKKAALIDLATACGVIYGPRAVTLYMRSRNQNKMAKRPTLTPDPKPAPAPVNRANGFHQPTIDDTANATPPELKKQETIGKLPEGFDPTKIKIN